jgi:hypothetical protein
MLGVLAANVKAGSLTLENVEWPDVHRIAESLSATYAMKNGHHPPRDRQASRVETIPHL